MSAPQPHDLAPSGVPQQPDLIDQPSGKYDPPPEAVDEALAQDGLSSDLLGLDLEDEFVTASHRKPKARSAVDLALLDMEAKSL